MTPSDHQLLYFTKLNRERRSLTTSDGLAIIGNAMQHFSVPLAELTNSFKKFGKAAVEFRGLDEFFDS